jgi:arginase
MATISVPYHLDERLEAFDAGLPVDLEITATLPAADPWARMAVLYEQVAQAVARQESPPLVISGDCTTSLAVLAGLQRAGCEPGIVWFDAHGDFHTEQTTTSGYLGGMPLALAAGIGASTLPAALRLRSVPEHRIFLVDARDTDPGEQELLARSAVHRLSVQDLHVEDLPAGDLYLHLDVDVVDAREVPDLLYPVPGGPPLDDVVDVVARITASGRVVGVGVAATWRHGGSEAPAQHRVLRRLSEAATQAHPQPPR